MTKPDIILSNTKLEALSFRLKSATGINERNLVDTIIINHRHNTEFNKVLITDTLGTNNERTTKGTLKTK